jgi:hypothetical protein
MRVVSHKAVQIRVQSSKFHGRGLMFSVECSRFNVLERDHDPRDESDPPFPAGR